ncbi:MAG: LON peptidase substrate-binding domain-containing protein [Rhodobiaceae bacterium]|nr:LON peptidase substrate-binding domain-containing protein [Rhodobiaceae bacterium]
MGINNAYTGPADLPDVLPVFPLSGALLLPRSEMPLNIFEPRYLAMVDAALAGNRLIGMVQPLPGTEASNLPPLSRVGCAGRITAFQETGDGRILITLTGISRFDVVSELTEETLYRVCRIDTKPYRADFLPPGNDLGIDRPRLIETLEAFLEANDLDADWDDIDATPSETLVNILSMMSPYGPREKQALLEARDARERSEMLIAITERVLMDDGEGEGLQ